MELGKLNKCNNCGAELEAGAATTIKCAYCGSVYDNNDRQAASVDPETIQVSPGTQTPPDGDKAKKGCAVFFLILTIILAVLAEIHKHIGFGTGLLASDSPVTDTAKVDTSNLLNLVDAEENAQKKHFKKTNPDPQILIKHTKLRTTKYSTNIFISGSK
jgi:hypothetical protein